ncbi:MAG: hypothetical protein KME17_29205 [Cyanosarcina radialis HA8281-LM2]|nr:hypothetical protein [Cyanosarcina radialis HA8281-LM2]
MAIAIIVELEVRRSLLPFLALFTACRVGEILALDRRRFLGDRSWEGVR